MAIILIFETIEDLSFETQSLKCKTNLKLLEIISDYSDGMDCGRQSGTFQFEEGSFNKNLRGIRKSYREVL